MTQLVHPILLCGGSGTRLWPLSRKSFPKQFARLTGDLSLFQASALRLSGPGFAAPTVVTGADFRFIVTEQLAEASIKPQEILIEPQGRNTAPAILAAALALHHRAKDALMLVAPSDHVIPDVAAFQAAVQAAIPAALDGQLVTFGIRPTRAETGYGWLELPDMPRPSAPAALPLVSFVEKPDAARAKAMLDGGRHLWNAGIFLFTTTALIEAVRRIAPGMLADAQAAIDLAERDLAFTRLEPVHFGNLPDISIDHAVMEKSSNLSVVPFDGHWSDLGDWQAVLREGGTDADGNLVSDHALAIGCTDSLLRSDSDGVELVGIGLKGVIAVAMKDAVLIADASRTQDVKGAVQALKAARRDQAESFPRDHRPWGDFERLALGPRFQVKRISVHPGGALSLQSHHHRSEHWIVVEGTARVTIGEEVKLVTENQSVYIPLGSRHRLENPGKVPLTVIEVQTGSYLGEDDILRYEDVYARGQGAKG